MSLAGFLLSGWIQRDEAVAPRTSESPAKPRHRSRQCIDRFARSAPAPIRQRRSERRHRQRDNTPGSDDCVGCRHQTPNTSSLPGRANL